MIHLNKALLLLLFITGTANSSFCQLDTSEYLSLGNKKMDYHKKIVKNKTHQPITKKMLIIYLDANIGNRRKMIESQVLKYAATQTVEIILVGIDNPEHTSRINIFSPYHTIDKSDSLSAAQILLSEIKETLIPRLVKNFGGFDRKILYGHSLSGLFTSWVYTQKNHGFDLLVAASPSCWVLHEKLRHSISNLKQPKGELHLLTGGYEQLNKVHYSTSRYYYTFLEQKINKVHFHTFSHKTHNQTIRLGFLYLLTQLAIDEKVD